MPLVSSNLTLWAAGHHFFSPNLRQTLSLTAILNLVTNLWLWEQTWPKTHETTTHFGPKGWDLPIKGFDSLDDVNICLKGMKKMLLSFFLCRNLLNRRERSSHTSSQFYRESFWLRRLKFSLPIFFTFELYKIETMLIRLSLDTMSSLGSG